MSGDALRSAHSRAEALVAGALRAADPAAALARAARDPGLSPELRDALAAADADGVRLAALLVAKLRFERLLRGSERAAAWFEQDGPAFAAAFRRYHEEVAPTAFWPAEEGASFDAWSTRTSSSAPPRPSCAPSSPRTGRPRA